MTITATVETAVPPASPVAQSESTALSRGGSEALQDCTSPTLPEDVSRAMARVDAVREGLVALAGLAAGAAGWSGAQRESVWAAVDRLSGALTAARGAWLSADEAAGTLVGAADSSSAAAVARRTRGSMGTGHRQVRQARTLQAFPAVREAVTEGAIPVAHLDALGRVLERASETARDVLTSPEGQEIVRELARQHGLTLFVRELERWVASLDPAALEDAHAAQRRERFLILSHGNDGVRVRGRLDRLAGEVLHRALDLVGEKPGEDRTPDQARADALETLARTALAAPVHGSSGASVRPHITLLVDPSALAREPAVDMPGSAAVPAGSATGSPGSADGSPSSAGGSPDSVAGSARLPIVPGGARVGLSTGLPPVTTEDGVPVPWSQVARILCDADLSRLVMNAQSEVVDLGRTVRTYSGIQRRAVIARDEVCAYPLCAKPARWCEVHHIDWWRRDDGPTSVENGVLLCVHHHHVVHELRLSIVRTPGPPSPVPGRRSRPRYRFYDPAGAELDGAAPDCLDLDRQASCSATAGRGTAGGSGSGRTTAGGAGPAAARTTCGTDSGRSPSPSPPSPGTAVAQSGWFDDWLATATGPPPF